MTQFHEGQEVEVNRATGTGPDLRNWEHATIICASTMPDGSPSGYYTVRFRDGSHGLVDTKHIRPMTTFHEGQEVEIRLGAYIGPAGWRKAKIVGWTACRNQPPRYEVQFHDGNHGMADAAHIRAVSPLDEHFSRPPTTEAEHQTMLAGDSAEEYPGLAEPDDDTSDPMGSGATP